MRMRSLKKEAEWERSTYKKVTLKFRIVEDAELIAKIESHEGIGFGGKLKNLLKTKLESSD